MKITKPALLGLEFLLAIGVYLIHPILSLIAIIILVTTWSY